MSPARACCLKAIDEFFPRSRCERRGMRQSDRVELLAGFRSGALPMQGAKRFFAIFQPGQTAQRPTCPATGAWLRHRNIPAVALAHSNTNRARIDRLFPPLRVFACAPRPAAAAALCGPFRQSPRSARPGLPARVAAPSKIAPGSRPEKRLASEKCGSRENERVASHVLHLSSTRLIGQMAAARGGSR